MNHVGAMYITFNSYILIKIKAIVCYKYDNLCAVHHIYVTTCIDRSPPRYLLFVLLFYE